MNVVYILFSTSINKYYCGQTANLQERLERHNSGRSKFTKSGVPWKLVHSISCSNRSEAIRLESKIKKRGIKRYLLDNHVLGV